MKKFAYAASTMLAAVALAVAGIGLGAFNAASVEGGTASVARWTSTEAPGDGWPEITRSRKGWFNIGNASGKTRMASAGLVIARMIEPLLLTTARVSTHVGQRLLTGASGFFFERGDRPIGGAEIPR